MSSAVSDPFGVRAARWVRAVVVATVALAGSGAGWAEDGADSAAPASDAPLPTFEELEAAGATIGEIRIVVGDVFDTTDPKENNALFRTANRLHVETHPGVIRRGLLFASGDRLDVHVITSPSSASTRSTCSAPGRH